MYDNYILYTHTKIQKTYRNWERRDLCRQKYVGYVGGGGWGSMKPGCGSIGGHT